MRRGEERRGEKRRGEEKRVGARKDKGRVLETERKIEDRERCRY